MENSLLAIFREIWSKSLYYKKKKKKKKKESTGTLAQFLSNFKNS